MTEDLQARLFERHEKRVAQGAKRLNEARQRMADYYGEGGVKLTRREKADLYLQAALDPMGQQMTEILARRQQANKLGPTAIPKDWIEWDVAQWAKHLEGRLMPEGEEQEA